MMMAPKGFTACRHGGRFAGSIVVVLAVLMGAIEAALGGEDLMELTCSNPAQCQLYQRAGKLNATCRNGRCECTDITDGQSVKCEPAVHHQNNIIGGECPCQLPNTVCKEHVCYCSESYVASNDRRRCIPRHVPLRGACEKDEQCQAAGNYMASCDATDKQCVCMAGYGESDNGGGKCIPRIDDSTMNGTCGEDAHCKHLGAHAECSAMGRCVCKSGFVASGNATECRKLPLYGQPCSSDSECQLSLGWGGVCSKNGICGCRIDYAPLNTDDAEGADAATMLCHRLKLAGQYCFNDTDCRQSPAASDGDEEQTLRCLYGECNCREGYRLAENAQCLSGANAVGHSIEFVVALTAMGLVLQNRRSP